MTRIGILIFAVLCTIAPLQAGAEEDALATELAALQEDWAVANYRTPEGDPRASAFESLSARAEALVQAHPERAEALIWLGIVKSTWAASAGPLRALRLVRESRSALEQAEAIDPTALQGSIYTSLGALYANVPPWPVSFGDDDRAREYFLRALEQNPEGIDPNYFYGSFLADQGESAEAQRYLERALRAPDRPGRPVADAGRRSEARQILTSLGVGGGSE